MEMGAKIKMLREQNSMTLEELGNKVGVGKSTVRKWENGMIANMRRDKIAKLATALGCSPAYLMGWTEEIEIASNTHSESLEDLSSLDVIIASEEKAQLLKWKDVIGDTIFTDEEFNQIVAYAKFLLSQR